MYRIAKTELKNQHGFLEDLIKTYAAKMDISEQKARVCLQKPWAIRQLVIGKLAAEIREKEEIKRRARIESATKLIHLYEVVGIPLDRIIN